MNLEERKRNLRGVDYTDLQEVNSEKFDKYVAEYREVFGEAPWETENREENLALCG